MRALGFDVKKAEIHRIITEYDKGDGAGLMDFESYSKVSKYFLSFLSFVNFYFLQRSSNFLSIKLIYELIYLLNLNINCIKL